MELSNTKHGNGFIDRTGEKNVNYQGLEMVIVRYNTNQDIDVLFTNNGYISKNKAYGNFIRGQIRKEKKDMKVNKNNLKDVCVDELKSGHLYEFKPIDNTGYTFLAIYMIDCGDKECLVDLDDDTIYNDVENYVAIREIDFEINILD